MDAVALAASRAFTKRGFANGGGWSVISMKSAAHLIANTGNTAQTTRVAQITPFAVYGLKAVFHNWYQNGSGENPFPNAIQVRADVQIVPAGASFPYNESNSFNPVIPLTFGGRERVWIKGGRMAVSDPILQSIPAGAFYFIKSYVVGSLFAAPSAPTLATATTGGALTASAGILVALTYVYPDGVESLASASSAQATTGSTSTITVTAPTSAAGALGYRVYAAGAGATTLYATDSGVVPFGTNYVYTQAVNSTPLSARDCVTPGQSATHPQGISIGGGTGNNAPNNGEGFANNVDRCGEGIAVSASSSTSVFGPAAVLGLTPDRVMPSLAIIGDSIPAATADHAFIGRQNWGGYAIRATLGQTTARAHVPTQAPLMGHVWLACGGERGDQFSSTTGTRRTQLASLCTSVLCDYGTNDLAQGSAGATVANTLLTIAGLFTGQRKKFLQSTILPKTGVSTDGWRTVTNQLYSATAPEGHRRQLNSFLLKAGGQSTVSAEAMFGCYAGTPGPSTNLYGGGNGTAAIFLTRQIFVQGSESITVGGAAKVLTTDYTYLGAVTVGGIAYASGVTFLSAPSNSAAVLASYTAAAGFKTLAGSFAEVIDLAAVCECDAAGIVGTNGGWWIPDTSTARVTGTPTSVTTTSISDTTKTWTTDQHRGYSVRIVTDTTTPTAVGQVRTIAWNTATFLGLASAWTVTPSTAATYEVADCPTQEGTHPLTRLHMAMGAAIDLTKVT